MTINHTLKNSQQAIFANQQAFPPTLNSQQGFRTEQRAPLDQPRNNSVTINQTPETNPEATFTNQQGFGTEQRAPLDQPRNNPVMINQTPETNPQATFTNQQGFPPTLSSQQGFSQNWPIQQTNAVSMFNEL
jgi:hypothetical protein